MNKPLHIHRLNHARMVRDWDKLLCVLGALLLVGIVWSAYVYASVRHGDVISESVMPNSPSTDRTSTQSVDEVFMKRTLEAQKYETGAYVFVDPSK